MKLPTSHCPKKKKKGTRASEPVTFPVGMQIEPNARARYEPQPNPLKASTGEVAVRVGCVRTNTKGRSRIGKVGRYLLH